MLIDVIDTTAEVARLSEELAEARNKIVNLEFALISSRRIGMAIGILMARHGATAEQSFEMLRSASQKRHRKLRDLADEVVFTGALPDLDD